MFLVLLLVCGYLTGSYDEPHMPVLHPSVLCRMCELRELWLSCSKLNDGKQVREFNSARWWCKHCEAPSCRTVCWT